MGVGTLSMRERGVSSAEGSVETASRGFEGKETK
jgi:hypothetical protein